MTIAYPACVSVPSLRISHALPSSSCSFTATNHTTSGRLYASAGGPTSPPNANTGQSLQDPTEAKYRSHTRDLSGSRGRGPAPSNVAFSNLQSHQANSSIAPRSQSSASIARSPAGPNGTLERRPSATQVHYRQPSRVHGNHPQSRNAIFVKSPATSPLSPEIPAAIMNNAGFPDFATFAVNHHQNSDRYASESSTLLGSIHSSSTSAASTLDQSLGNVSGKIADHKGNERTHPSKSRSGHHHRPSQSRQHQEQKTVGEYALHHLFNKVIHSHIPETCADCECSSRRGPTKR